MIGSDLVWHVMHQSVGGGRAEGGARVSNDWCVIFAGWRVNQVGFEGFHPQKVEKFFPVLIFLMFTL